jgi:hypothetical protein
VAESCVRQSFFLFIDQPDNRQGGGDEGRFALWVRRARHILHARQSCINHQISTLIQPSPSFSSPPQYQPEY